MTYIIDAHEDLAYNSLSFARDYRRPAAETRRLEAGTDVPARTGECTLGWADYQRAQVALIIATLFAAPSKYSSGGWETQAYGNPVQAARLYHQQIDFYHRLTDESPDKFQLVRTRKELAGILQPWEQPAAGDHPVGLMMSLEGGEGLGRPEELEEYWEMGLRAVGPVWAGTRFCGGTMEPGGFSREGYALLDVMAGLGYMLDLAHMTEQSALQALDHYEGTILASHVNARALLKGGKGERHFTDITIRRLAERGGVMGILPYNSFLLPGWKNGDDRRLVTLNTVAEQMDHVCQLTGSVEHVAIGTDFDGGFGWPAIPLEFDTIGDLDKLEPMLLARGYSKTDTAAILHGNWLKILEQALP